MGSPPNLPPGQPQPYRDGDFKGASQSAKIRFLVEGVQPPSRVYIGLDDRLIVSLVSNTDNITVQANSRLLLPNNVIVPISEQLNAPTAGTLAVQTFQLAEGFLLSVLPVLTASLAAGQWAYCSIGLRRGAGNIMGTYEVLYAGYIGGTFTRGYPEAALVGPGEGNGTTLTKVVAAVTSTMLFTVVVPPYATWRLNSFEADLSTDSNVANRKPFLSLADGSGNEFLTSSGDTQIPASTAAVIDGGSAGKGIASGNDSCSFILFPSGMLLGPGFQINLYVDGAGGGDTFTNLALNVTEWLALL